MDRVLKLTTETDIDEVTEGCLGVFLEILVPHADPILEADTTRVAKGNISLLLTRVSTKITTAALVNSFL